MEKKFRISDWEFKIKESVVRRKESGDSRQKLDFTFKIGDCRLTSA